MSDKELMQILKQIEESKGFQISQKISILSISTYIFHSNTSELCSSIDFFNNPSSIVFLTVDNREKLKDLINNIVRLFHNYLASVKTLIDHTTNFLNKEYRNETDFLMEYATQLDTYFKKNPSAIFIQDLRNYFLHYKIPPIFLSENQEDTTISVLIKLQSLQSSSYDWDKLSKEYINSMQSDIKLIDIVINYAQLVSEFYQWFGERQAKLHEKEIGEMTQLQNQYRLKKQELYSNHSS